MTPKRRACGASRAWTTRGRVAVTELGDRLGDIALRVPVDPVGQRAPAVARQLAQHPPRALRGGR